MRLSFGTSNIIATIILLVLPLATNAMPSKIALTSNINSKEFTDPDNIEQKANDAQKSEQQIEDERDEIVIELATDTLKDMINGVRVLPEHHEEYRAVFLLRAAEAIALNLILAASGDHDPEVLAKKFANNLLWSVKAAKTYTNDPEEVDELATKEESLVNDHESVTD